MTDQAKEIAARRGWVPTDLDDGRFCVYDELDGVLFHAHGATAEEALLNAEKWVVENEKPKV